MIPTLSLFQVRVSKFAILLGDALAFAVAFALATLINVALDPSGSIAIWFSTQDMQRYAAWSGLVFLGLMLFLMRFQHYSDRRPFWDELGDILRLVGILAVLDMTLIAATRCVGVVAGRHCHCVGPRAHTMGAAPNGPLDSPYHHHWPW